MVGDTVHDMQMGHALGVRTAAVTFGAGSIADLYACCPTWVVDDFPSLLSAIRPLQHDATREVNP